jgi:hypothetical protein
VGISWVWGEPGVQLLATNWTVQTFPLLPGGIRKVWALSEGEKWVDWKPIKAPGQSSLFRKISLCLSP